jgi:altronate hydrolase
MAAPVRLLRIDPRDNVAVALSALAAGDDFAVCDAVGAAAAGASAGSGATTGSGAANGRGPGGAAPAAACLDGGRASEAVPAGHKLALTDIPAGGAVIKYGRTIGLAKGTIAAGSWVHGHNLASGLHGHRDFAALEPSPGGPSWTAPLLTASTPRSFLGYRRADGQAGIRNEIWILPTVGCIASAALRVAEKARAIWPETWAFSHPYGCSQLGGDLEATQRVLAGLARNPNAGGVLFLSLGCENNTLESFRKVLGPVDEQRVRFLVLQDEGDDLDAALREIEALAATLRGDRREELPLSELRVGLKCGGSDGFSGITANPLVGRVSDLLVAAGGSALLTEVPEMFGAEEELLGRAASKEVFVEAVSMVDRFKDYYVSHGQEIYENPSPGNRDGGITTLEEKSSGCVRKGGSSPVVEVLAYGGRATRRGLGLLEGPGNDQVSSTALAAAGVQLILFTTGRGTPYGSPVPTLKIATNSSLAARKPGWIDFDAGRMATGADPAVLALELLDLVARTASGTAARNEKNGYRDIAIFKDGVTL